MKDKYRLAEKFLVLSACPHGDDAELDMKAFKSMKIKRDNLFHGKLKNEEALPVAEVLQLLKKCLRLHITAKHA